MTPAIHPTEKNNKSSCGHIEKTGPAKILWPKDPGLVKWVCEQLCHLPLNNLLLWNCYHRFHPFQKFETKLLNIEKYTKYKSHSFWVLCILIEYFNHRHSINTKCLNVVLHFVFMKDKSLWEGLHLNVPARRRHVSKENMDILCVTVK